MIFVIIAVPIAITVLAIVQWRGWMRWVAFLPLIALIVTGCLDIVGWSESSNLTGLFTMLAILPALGTLLVVAIIDYFIQAIRKRTLIS